MKKSIFALMISVGLISNANASITNLWLVPVDTYKQCEVVSKSLSNMYGVMKNPRNSQYDVMNFMESESKRISYPIHFYTGYANILYYADPNFTPKDFYNLLMTDCNQYYK